MTSVAERLFDGGFAESELEDILDTVGVPETRRGWDHYDCSLELYDIDPDYRLTDDAQRAIHGAGFIKVYVNHTDKWETHYTWKSADDFAAVKGWRVSYPHKRGEGEKGIWVEEMIPTWPKDWFESGYALIKRLTVGG